MINQIPGDTTKKYLIYHISKNNHHSKKRFPAFYSSSQGLSNGIIVLSDFTKKIIARFGDVINYDVII